MRHPGDYTLQQVQSLPEGPPEHAACLRGGLGRDRFIWRRTGVRFLALVGADTGRRFLTFECADDYYESLDMPTALHPQSLLCYEMYGQPLDRGHGAPLRLNLPTKLGYKQAKYLTRLTVANVLPAKHGVLGGPGL